MNYNLKMSNKKKVIAFILDPINLSTGAYKSTIRTLNLLSKRKFKTIVIADNSPSSKKANFPKTTKVYRVKSQPLAFDKNLWLALPQLEELERIFIKEKVDIIHTVMPTIASQRAMKVARKLNLKIVAHSHTQPENFMPYVSKSLWPLIKFSFNQYLKYFYSKSDVIICPSKFSQELLKQQKSSFNTVIISNGINLEHFKSVNQESKPLQAREYSLSLQMGTNKANRKLRGIKPIWSNKKNEIIKVLYSGRLDPEKDIPTLVKAFAILEAKNAELNIIGKGLDQERIEQLVKKLNISKKVHLLGRVSEKVLIENYQNSDIFVLPSVAELEGMVVLEAMACGNPIIVSDSKDSASKDFVKGNGLLFKAKNPIDLSKKLKILIENPALRRKMSKRSLENVKEYDIKKSIQKLERVYETI